MPLNLLDGLPEMGGFNRLEKDEYYRLFIDSQQDTVELLTLASQVADDNGWTLEETVNKLQSARANKIEAIASLGAGGLGKLLEFMDRQNKARLMQGFDLAKLILRSRLSVEWLKGNQDELATYGIEFEIQSLENIPRRNWLKNEQRAFVIEQLTDLLPAPVLRSVEDFATKELHEGKLPEPDSDKGRDSDPLAPPSASTQKLNKPTRKNENSGTTVISESKVRGFQTPVTSGSKSA